MNLAFGCLAVLCINSVSAGGPGAALARAAGLLTVVDVARGRVACVNQPRLALASLPTALAYLLTALAAPLRCLYAATRSGARQAVPSTPRLHAPCPTFCTLLSTSKVFYEFGVVILRKPRTSIRFLCRNFCTGDGVVQLFTFGVLILYT